jgi:hypothetical protein
VKIQNKTRTEENRMPVFVIVAHDYAEHFVFARVVHARDRNTAIGRALFDENHERSFERQLQRSKLYYSIRTVEEYTPELDDLTSAVAEGNNGSSEEVPG